MQQTSFNGYGSTRLAAIGLNDHPQIKALKNGRIAIYYTNLLGQDITYLPNVNECSVSIERHEVPYKRERLNPEMPFDAEKIAKNQRYTQSKGTGVFPFLPFQISNFYKSKTKLDLLTFTEGEIKAAIATKKGLPSVAFAGISVYKLDNDLRELVRTCKPENIVIQYDSDCTDQKTGYKFRRGSSQNNFFWSAWKFATELLEFITSENLAIQLHICKGNGIGGKGLDDIILSNPLSSVPLFKSLESNELFTFKALNFDSLLTNLCAFFGVREHWYKAKTTPHLEGFGNLLDTLQANKIGLNPEGFCNRIWIVPTGFGKSYAVTEFSKNFNSVMLCPNTGLRSEIIAQAAKKGIDCVEFPTERENLAIRLGANDKPKLILACYQSFGKLANLLGSQCIDYHLFIDEFHCVTTSASKTFCLENMLTILDYKTQFASFTGLTGTQIYNFESSLQKMPISMVKCKKDIDKVVYFQQCEGSIIATVAEMVKQSLDCGRTPVVLMDNKSEKLDTLKDAILEQIGNRFKAFNSTTKDTPEWRELIDTRAIPEGVECFVTTSVLKEGNNINNELELVDVFVVTPFHPIELEQFTARFRNAKNIHLHLLKGKKETSNTSKKQSFFCPFYQFEKLKRECIEICKSINKWDNVGAFAQSYKTLRNGITPITDRHKEGTFEFCELEASNAIFQMEKMYLYYSNDAAMLGQLQAFGFRKIGVKALKFELPKDIKQLAANRKAKQKGELLRQFNECLEVLKDAPSPKRCALDKIGNNDKNPFYLDFVKTCEYAQSDAKALELFGNTEGDKKAVSLLQKRLKWAYNAKLVRNEQCALVGVIKALRTAFPSPLVGYNSEQVKAIFLDCISQDSNINADTYRKQKRNDAILKVLRLMYDCEKFKDTFSFTPIKMQTKKIDLENNAHTDTNYYYTFDS